MSRVPLIILSAVMAMLIFAGTYPSQGIDAADDVSIVATEQIVDSVPVDLEIVIAINVSWSMDLNELALQRSAFIDAFSDAEFAERFLRNGNKSIAIHAFEWAGESVHHTLVPWRLVEVTSDVPAIAQSLKSHSLRAGKGASLPSALEMAIERLDDNPYQGSRRAILLISATKGGNSEDLVRMRDALAAAKVDLIVIPLMVRAPWGARELDKFFADHLLGDDDLLRPVTDIFELPTQLPGTLHDLTAE